MISTTVSAIQDEVITGVNAYLPMQSIEVGKDIEAMVVYFKIQSTNLSISTDEPFTLEMRIGEQVNNLIIHEFNAVFRAENAVLKQGEKVITLNDFYIFFPWLKTTTQFLHFELWNEEKVTSYRES